MAASRWHSQELAPEAMIAQAERFYLQMQARRSVRDFSERSVPMRVIEQAILAAGTAPSGANKQPWHFAVTTDPDVKAVVRSAAEQEERAFYERRASQQWLDALAPLGTDANKPFLQTAPVLMGVFMEKTCSVGGRRAEQKLLPHGVCRYCLRAVDLCAASVRPGHTDAYAKPNGLFELGFREAEERKTVFAVGGRLPS